MLGISWVAAQLAASQEGLSSTSEWIRNVTSILPIYVWFVCGNKRCIVAEALNLVVWTFQISALTQPKNPVVIKFNFSFGNPPTFYFSGGWIHGGQLVRNRPVCTSALDYRGVAWMNENSTNTAIFLCSLYVYLWQICWNLSVVFEHLSRYWQLHQSYWISFLRKLVDGKNACCHFVMLLKSEFRPRSTR
jgi:hypothetical protein